MKASLFVVADYANKSLEGKLNIIGIFRHFHAQSYPMRIGRMFLVVRFEADVVETRELHDIAFILVNADGHDIAKHELKVMLDPPQGGATHITDSLFEWESLIIPSPGWYEFKLVINKDVKASIEIEAITINPSESDQ